jgi:hypothetical protein
MCWFIPHELIAQSTDNGLFEGTIQTYMVDGKDLKGQVDQCLLKISENGSLGVFIFQTGVENITDPVNLTNGNLFESFVFANGEKDGPVTFYSDVFLDSTKQEGFSARAIGSINHGNSISFMVTHNTTRRNLLAVRIAIQ